MSDGGPPGQQMLLKDADYDKPLGDILTGEAILFRGHFDEKTDNFMLCGGCLIACMSLPIAGGILMIPCIPCIKSGLAKGRKFRRLVVTDRGITYRKGGYGCCAMCCWGESTKNVSFEKITDVEVSQGWLERQFNVKHVQVQTAGSSNPQQGAEIDVHGIIEADQFRKVANVAKDAQRKNLDVEKAVRDYLETGDSTMLNMGPVAPQSGGGGGGGGSSAVQLEIRDLQKDIRDILLEVRDALKQNGPPGQAL